jgi:hypothetical protein
LGQPLRRALLAAFADVVTFGSGSFAGSQIAYAAAVR